MKLAIEQITDMVRNHFSYDGSMEAEAVAFLNGMIDKTLTATEFPAFLQGITKIWNYAFYDCRSFQPAEIPASVEEIGNDAFSRVTGADWSVTFKGTPKLISAYAFDSRCTAINVPWAEGEVANAPWGATNATINYNYTGE